jgi:PhnB protein
MITKKAKSIPQGFSSLTTYITVKDTVKAIDFYNTAFEARETGRITMPDGSIGHAELEIGDSKLWLADENVQWGNLSPETLHGSPVSLCLYVEDADRVFNNALKAGAKALPGMEVKDQFHGDRSGSLTDPFGYKWVIGTHIEDVSFPEMQKRADKLFSASK